MPCPTTCKHRIFHRGPFGLLLIWGFMAGGLITATYAAEPRSAAQSGGSGPGGITRGSFSIRTVPFDPKPLQKYGILILIKLPKHVRRLPRTDITGMVIGSDLYMQLYAAVPPPQER